MEIQNTTDVSQTFRKEYNLSWIGHIKIIITIGILGASILSLIITAILSIMFSWGSNAGYICFGIIFTAIFLIVCFGSKESKKVIIDEDGVWFFNDDSSWSQGHKGSNAHDGIAWEFVEDAVYKTGLIAWLANSYTIIIRGRYREFDKMEIKDMKNGNKAVIFINEYRKELKRSSR